MKRTGFILLATIVSVLTSCNQNTVQEGSYTITGEIAGMDSGILVLTIQDTVFVERMATVENGTFVFEGTVSEPLMAALNIEGQRERASFFIEPGVMNISLNKEEIGEFELEGSKTQEEKRLFDDLLKPYTDKMQSIIDDYGSLMDSIRSTEDEQKIEEWTAIINELGNKYGELAGMKDSLQFSYVVDNPESYIAGYYLTSVVRKDDLELDSLKAIYKGMDEQIRESINGQKAAAILKKKENTVIGAVVPDFEVVDVNKDMVTLSQFKGKHAIMIDFWASWCGPCKMSMPHLLEVYEKYHSEGLEVMAVADGDYDRERWVAAIEEHGLGEVINVASDFRNGEVVNAFFDETYFHAGIPFTILVDFEGKIAGTWLGYSEDISVEMDQALEELFAK